MYKVQFSEFLKEDELAMFWKAIGDVRKYGFGEVTIFFRNGYVYKVKATTDYTQEIANNHEKNP